MSKLCSHLGVLVALSITATIIASWLFLWHHRSHRKGMIPSDTQIVRLLVNLLIFAVFSTGLFLFFIIGSMENWNIFCP